MEIAKTIHSIVLDTSPLLVNEPSISTLLSKAEKIYTVPQVISEIKDKNACARLEMTVLPFLTIRSPSAASIKIITEFGRKTGDLAVLSRPDIHILALTYELECELNHGDWRLRSTPGQQRMNGPPPSRNAGNIPQGPITEAAAQLEVMDLAMTSQSPQFTILRPPEQILPEKMPSDEETEDATIHDLASGLNEADLGIPTTEEPGSNFEGVLADLSSPAVAHQESEQPSESESDELDPDGWITPSNIKKQQAMDRNVSTAPQATASVMQVAAITTDFAMQNVLLQMNLNLLSPAMLRVRQLKNYILRCHACFEKTKDMTKQFCPRCGKPTLTRVACSTNANGEFKIHLKKNMQWDTRGDRFSIPKPVAGTSNGKVRALKGGGKGGWGHELILAEDQKEYIQAVAGQSRKKERNLMDDDYLPGILTGNRARSGGRPKVGAGRNVNSKKR